MKRFFIVLAVFFTFSTFSINDVCAQEMSKGSGLLNVGFGFVPGFGANVSYDFGLIDALEPGIFTIGGMVGIQTWGKNYSYREEYRVNSFLVSSRATYRYPINRTFEVYATVMLGVNIMSYSKYYKDENLPFFGTTVGCRYSFSHALSVFTEIGYNIAYFNGGLSFSF